MKGCFFEMKREPLLVIGAGGHAKVLIDILLGKKENIIGIFDKNDKFIGEDILGIPIIGTDNDITNYSPGRIRLVNGIGSVKSTSLRKSIYNQFKKKGYIFHSVIHPSAILSEHVLFSEGCQVCAGVIISAGTKIGSNTIINTQAVIEHDCIINEHIHIAPGCVISGGVHIGSGTHVGAGSTIIQNVQVGENVLIAAGAVVVNNIQSSQQVYGIPAKER